MISRSYIMFCCIICLIAIDSVRGDDSAIQQKIVEDPYVKNALNLRREQQMMNTLASREREELIKNFLAIDEEKLPEELRYEYIDNKLLIYQEKGDWNTVLKIRDKLMRPRKSKTDRLLDADLLNIIAGYFAYNPFPPPPETMKDISVAVKDKYIRNYWEKHYRDYKEAERILRYILEHFDPNYSINVNALRTLAYLVGQMGRHEEALNIYKQYEKLDLEQIYDVDHSSSYLFGNPRPDTKKRISEMRQVWKTRPIMQMAEEAQHLAYPKAIEELKALKQKTTDPDLTDMIDGMISVLNRQEQGRLDLIKASKH